MPAEGRENPLLKKGNSDAFFREKYLTKNKSRKTAPKSKISTIAEQVWYNGIDGGSQPQEGAMYL